MIYLFLVFVAFSSCQSEYKQGAFGFDWNWIRKYDSTAILLNVENTSIVISPTYQGRILTSSFDGLHGRSNGWINHDQIRNGLSENERNSIGGEDRMWLGPEYGIYSPFFPPGAELIAENIVVPAALNNQVYDMSSLSRNSVLLTSQCQLSNNSGYEFLLDVERKIELYSRSQIKKQLKIDFRKNVKVVGFTTQTKLKNTGADWSKAAGLLSIWSIGAFQTSDNNHALIPTWSDSIQVNQYWTQETDDRLRIEDDFVRYKVDGNKMHKFGLSPNVIRPVFGSFNRDAMILTIIKFTLNKKGTYVNSQWDLNAPPYEGEAINIFNGGPNENGENFGRFYELESSSSTYELNNSDALYHTHTTFHFYGDLTDLNVISKSILGIDLAMI